MDEETKLNLAVELHQRNQGKDKWDKIESLGPIITSLASIVTSVGVIVFGSLINSSLQKQRLQFDQINKMREPLAIMTNGNNTLSDKEAAALVLSVYGPGAAALLFSELHAESDPHRVSAAKKGLLSLSFYHKESVCAPLVSMLGNRTRIFTWEDHLNAIELLGGAGCNSSEAKTALENFLPFVESPNKEKLAAYKKIININNLPPTVSDLKMLNEALTETRKLLDP